MAIELHQRECTAAAGRESLEVALRQLRLMEVLLAAVPGAGPPRPARRESVSLVELVDDVAALVRPACLHAGIELAVSKPAAALRTSGDPRTSARWR